MVVEGSMKPWSWEVAGSGQGPDWVFLLEIIPLSREVQAAVAALPPPPGYVAGGRNGDTAVWVDLHNLEQYRRNLQGAQQNIWRLA
jgi:hypothetical protein